VALYSPELHESLTPEPWSAQRARAAMASVVADADSGYDDASLWPPADPWDDWGGAASPPLTALSTGAAGAAWGLDALRRRGHAETRLDLARVAARALEEWRAAPDTPERFEPPVATHASLMMGETGPLLAACKLATSIDTGDALHARVLANHDNETNELYAGAPGTMVAARAMLDWTGDTRWAEAWRASAGVLLARRHADGFWTYPPYGKGIGASHGIGTNARILVAGGDLLPDDVRERLPRETAAALAATAVVEDGLANWPMAVGDDLVPWDGQIRVQWCHGAAGVVESAGAWLDEELLRAGAQLVWEAGPPSLDKGTGICHGTAGSGYALLRVFERTGDELWLDRARRFAMHVAWQVEHLRTRRGRGRVTLWTGDVGAALFLAACLDGDARLPIVDVV
jgi:hypothetical protein